MFCREFRKKMEVAKGNVQAVKKKLKEAEKPAEVMNISQNNSKRQVVFNNMIATCNYLSSVSVVV